MKDKCSIFRSTEGERLFYKSYDECLTLWDVPYESRYIHTSYGRTHVIVSGPEDGEPVLLLHGMTFNSTMWATTVPALTKGGYRTYCVDVPGDFGKSEVTVPMKKRQDCAEWLQEVMNALQLEKANLIGHSMGGWMSLYFALACPDRVNKLVLLAPIMSFVRLPIKFMLKVYPVMLRPSRAKIAKLWTWFLAKGSQLHPVVMEHIVQGWLHCRPQHRVVPNVFDKRQLLTLQPKTLFLVGDEEVVYDANVAINRVASSLPDAAAEIVPKSSHCFVAEQPDIVNDRIVKFLQA